MLSALFRRETNQNTPADRRSLLSYAEDLAANSCHSTRNCKLSESPRSTFLICFSPDMTRMASSHGDHTVRVVNCQSGLNTHTLKGHPRTPWCVTFHPSSNDLLASGCLGGQVRVWDLKGGGSETYTPVDKAVIASLAFHPVGQILLIATGNKLLFWKWNQPAPIICVETASPDEKVRYVKFSPLGDHILTGVTNIVSPRTPSVPAAPAVRDPSSMQQFLRMVNCSRLGSDQVAAYILQPTTSCSPTTASSSNSYSQDSSQPNNRAATNSSEPSTDRAGPARQESAPRTNNSNSSRTSTNTVDGTGPGTSQDAASGDSRSSANGDYRGVFAIFRARDSGSWNLDETDVENEPPDVQPGSVLLDQGRSDDSVDFTSYPGNSDVSVSVNTDSSAAFPGEASGLQSVSFRAHPDWSTENANLNSNPDPPAATASNNVDGVVGIGRVINVGGSSRNSPHNSSHSSSFSNIGNQEGNGTAVATATARTFRHVHTAVVVTDGANGGPQIALSTAINRAIAGAFAGSGEGAVASNIINTTHRLQWWDSNDAQPPDLKNGDLNVIVKACKIHNDASCDISSDGTMLAAFVPSIRGFPNSGVLALHSLRKETLGQCLFRKKFGPNAISVSLSPLNRYVMVGLAARRLNWYLTSQQLVAQIFRLVPDEKADSPQELDKPVHSVTHDCVPERRSHVSVNAAFWNPVVGKGIVYGTNKGHLRMCEIDQSPDKLPTATAF